MTSAKMPQSPKAVTSLLAAEQQDFSWSEISEAHLHVCHKRHAALLPPGVAECHCAQTPTWLFSAALRGRVIPTSQVSTMCFSPWSCRATCLKQGQGRLLSESAEGTPGPEPG